MTGCDLAAREAGRVDIFLALWVSMFEMGALNPRFTVGNSLEQ